MIGGAGSIGQAVTREIFSRNPRLLHVVDISENNMVELVRDIRSSIGYSDGEFATFAIDAGSDIFDSFISNGPGYDYILNLSALKHVRKRKGSIHSHAHDRRERLQYRQEYAPSQGDWI